MKGFGRRQDSTTHMYMYMNMREIIPVCNIFRCINLRHINYSNKMISSFGKLMRIYYKAKYIQIPDSRSGYESINISSSLVT